MAINGDLLAADTALAVAERLGTHDLANPAGGAGDAVPGRYWDHEQARWSAKQGGRAAPRR